MANGTARAAGEPHGALPSSSTEVTLGSREAVSADRGDGAAGTRVAERFQADIARNASAARAVCPQDSPIHPAYAATRQ